MLERWQGTERRTDGEYVLRMGVLPGLATILAMAVGFGLVAGVLFLRDALIVDSVATQVLALAVMYVLPLFAVGLWNGYRHGLVAAPAVAAGVTPLLVLVLALVAFGGPVLTPFERPLVAVVAVAFWSVICGLGIFVGATVIEPRVGTDRA